VLPPSSACTKLSVTVVLCTYQHQENDSNVMDCTPPHIALTHSSGLPLYDIIWLQRNKTPPSAGLTALVLI